MWAMKENSRPSPTELALPFQLDAKPAAEKLTGLAGVALLVQAFRSLALPARIRCHVQVKERERGYDEATLVESFVILNAVGGDCLEDFDRLREDEGLPELIGHAIPSASVARKFLYRFHEEENILEAQQRRLPGEIAYIPEENAALAGRGQVNRELIGELGQRCPQQRIATVDQDASIYESRKREALPT
jgi:hypothetical protein